MCLQHRWNLKMLSIYIWFLYKCQPGGLIRYLARVRFLYFLCLSCVLSAADKTLPHVQLQWFHLSQFADFYVAESRKQFEREGLVVGALPKTSDADPSSVFHSREIDIAVSNFNNTLSTFQSVSTVTNYCSTDWAHWLTCHMPKGSRCYSTCGYDRQDKLILGYWRWPHGC